MGGGGACEGVGVVRGGGDGERHAVGEEGVWFAEGGGVGRLRAGVGGGKERKRGEWVKVGKWGKEGRGQEVEDIGR